MPSTSCCEIGAKLLNWESHFDVIISSKQRNPYHDHNDYDDYHDDDYGDDYDDDFEYQTGRGTPIIMVKVDGHVGINYYDNDGVDDTI